VRGAAVTFPISRESGLLVVVSFLIFLVLAEIGLRLYLRDHIFYDVEMSRYANLLKIDAANPKIGHVHRPNGVARLMGVEVRINSAGFRDDEARLERDHRRRLIFLGDSLTFGWGVEKRQSFEDRLERSLALRAPTEIINFGAGNYNTVQQVELFLETGLDYRPDAVVLFYFINDAEPVPRKSRFAWLGRSRVATFYWSRVKALFARWSAAPDYAAYYAALYDEGRPGWVAAKDALRRLRDECRERDIGLAVVLLPELHELADYRFAAQHALVTDFLDGLGIESLDLAPHFASEPDPQRLWVAPDDAHPNARAHRLIADFSLDFLWESALWENAPRENAPREATRP
jgi:lysophospholipase L1-like esterase